MNNNTENRELEKKLKHVKFNCFGAGAPTSTKGMLSAIGKHLGAF